MRNKRSRTVQEAEPQSVYRVLSRASETVRNNEDKFWLIKIFMPLCVIFKKEVIRVWCSKVKGVLAGLHVSRTVLNCHGFQKLNKAAAFIQTRVSVNIKPSDFAFHHDEACAPQRLYTTAQTLCGFKTNYKLSSVRCFFCTCRNDGSQNDVTFISNCTSVKSFQWILNKMW